MQNAYSMISGVFGISRFAFLCVPGLSVAAAPGAKGADGLEPELEQKSKATNQSALVRPPGVIPTEEAQQALKRMKTPAAGSGTWRQISVFDDTTSMQTNIVYEWQGPDGKKIQDEAVVPTVQVGQTPDDDNDQDSPAKGDEPLNKALQLLKAKS